MKMSRELIESTLDHIFVISFGAFIIVIFTGIIFYGVVGFYENNAIIKYSEFGLGVFIFAYGIYRFFKMIRHYFYLE